MQPLVPGFRVSLVAVFCCYSALVSHALRAQETQNEHGKNAARTKVVLFGTGTPVPDPEHSGPATAIVVDNACYLVDFGPGVVRRAKEAVLRRRIEALEPANLKVAFATHLHSDHTAGYSDLILTGWTAGRHTPLAVYGPAGLQSMTDTFCRLIESISRHALIPEETSGPTRKAGRSSRTKSGPA